MSMLDRLIGPFISALDVVLAKRARLDFGAGLAVTDGGAVANVTRVVATGLVLGGLIVDTLTARVGYMLGYDGTKLTLLRGVTVLQAGTIAINGVTPQAVSCTDIADGDHVVYTFKASGGTPQYACGTVLVTAGVGFECAGKAGDTSTFNYMVMRAGTLPS